VMALSFVGRYDEAAALAGEVVEAADASGVRSWMSTARLAYSLACFDRDPVPALAAMRQAAEIASDLSIAPGGNAAMLARAEAAHGDLAAAFDACRRSLRAYAAAGDRTSAETPFWTLASLLHRIGRHEPAATIIGCCASAGLRGYPELVVAIDDLRVTLGDEAFESLGAQGRMMDSATAFSFALAQIDEACAAGLGDLGAVALARAELGRVIDQDTSTDVP